MSSVRGLSPFNSRRQTLPDVIKALDIDSPAGLPASAVSSAVKGLSNEAPSSLASMGAKRSLLDSRKKSVFAENPVIIN